MLDPDISPSPIMAVAMLHALAAFDKGDGQAGVDALIAVIEDGRIDAGQLGDAFGTMLASGLIVPQRITPRLREAAAVSLLHATSILDVMVKSIGSAADEIDAKTLRSFHHFLAFLHELCVELGETIDDEACLAFLRTIKGSGKAAKLAKTLLTLHPDPDRSEQSRLAVSTQALEARCARVARWLEYKNGAAKGVERL